ncbi:MAG: D-alanyl-D-alanine carboxypeptidase family protein [Desulfocucumaceae bacterium]
MKIFGKKTFLLYIAAFFFLYTSSLANPCPAAASGPPVTANSAILMDASTGQVIFEHKGFSRKEPASLTKIMTSIIALEYGHLNEVSTIRKEAANIYIGQQINLARGDHITLDNLLKAALIYSANDSTVAIAQHVAGTEEKFVELMNAKALVLGALNTRFANTNGYHNPNHYTTAYDLALITSYALKNKEFSEVVSMPRATLHWADGKKERTVENTNGLVRNNSYEGICGVKTGTTIRAGNCLIAAARKNDRLLIAVILHSHDRYRDAIALLDYGFYKVSAVNLCDKSEHLYSLPVFGGAKDYVEAASVEKISVYLSEEDLKKVSRNVIALPLKAPVKTGQQVGTAIFTLNGHELARVSLVAAGRVDTPGIIFKLKELF